MTELTCLALKNNTDKATHGYCPHYERFIGELRLLPITMLEIGVADGSSLRMWRDWMPKAKIYGFDVSDYHCQKEKRITVIKGDQGEQHDLEELVKEIGGFHFVVDDGSHDSEDQKVSFTYLWPRLLRGGWYVIEDSFGIGSCLDLDSVAQGNNEIAELHLIGSNKGDVLLFLKKQ